MSKHLDQMNAGAAATDWVDQRDLVSEDVDGDSENQTLPPPVPPPQPAPQVYTPPSYEYPQRAFTPLPSTSLEGYTAADRSSPHIEISMTRRSLTEEDFEDDATQIKNRDELPSGTFARNGDGPQTPHEPRAAAASNPTISDRSPHMLQPGSLISGKYRLLHLLGKGGMGSVWAARNELTDRDFAIKFLLTDLARNKEALQRFFLEARACGQIKHPAVVDVYDMGQAEDGSPYLVMELLEGEGFDARLARASRFRPGEAAAWVAFVARGLEEAHVRGLVHRDLKPGNIFFALDDRGDVIPKILDFGVSKATYQRNDFVKTTTGAVLGSPAYMSPEQASGETDIDGRSDVWSLGVILYEAIAGVVPFDAANYNALMVTIISKAQQPIREIVPSVPEELSAIIDGALAKDRAQRISTARELADRLEAVAAKITSTAMPTYNPKTASISPPPSPKPFSTTQGTWSGRRSAKHKRSGIALATSVVALALVCAAIIAFWQTRPPMVAVAGRSVFALTTTLTHVKQEIDQIRTDAIAEEKAKQAEEEKKKQVVLQPAELPPAKKKPGAAPSGSVKPRAPHGNDANHGVDGPGF